MNLQSIIEHPIFIRLSKWLFWVALFTIFFLAFSPSADIGPDFEHVDKIKHAIAFLILTLLFMMAYRVGMVRAWFWMLLLGSLIEVVQYFLPYRDASLLDLMADMVGILVAMGLKIGPINQFLLGRKP
jgi:VanZ family protein